MPLLVFAVVVLLATTSGGKVFTPCGLLEELNRGNNSRSFICNRVCGGESEEFQRRESNFGSFQIDRGELCRTRKIERPYLGNYRGDVTDDLHCEEVIKKLAALKFLKKSSCGSTLYNCFGKKQLKRAKRQSERPKRPVVKAIRNLGKRIQNARQRGRKMV